MTWSRAAGNRRKIWLLCALTILALAPFVWGVSWKIAGLVTPHGAGAVATLLALIQSAGLGFLFWSLATSPGARLLAETDASPAGPGEKDALKIIEKLALSAGLAAPKLYVIESNTPNAFATAMGMEQPVLAVTRGLLQLLDRSELEAVLAHELSHIGNQDVGLNHVVASLMLFQRIPYLLFSREPRPSDAGNVNPRRNPWRLAVSPMGIYILVVGPLLAAAIRAGISRGREFLADTDAIELTGSPRGLLRALAKIGGSGSAMVNANRAFAHYYFANPAAATGGASLFPPAHPPVAERIRRLATIPGAPPAADLKEAIEAGRRYAREHPAIGTGSANGCADESASSKRGNIMGRVYRLLALAPTPVYEDPSTSGQVLTRLMPGALLVAFDDPGKMRQVNTAQQTFGYIKRTVRLAAVDGMIPAEVYDPEARAAAEAKLPPLGGPNPGGRPRHDRLSGPQIAVATAVFALVFAGVFLALSILAR